jgi:fumarate reductase subunit C
VPAVSSPIGGGLIKLGHGSTWAAASVGLAPYAVCASLYVVFVVSYLAAVLRYLCADAAGQQAMERFITVSANAVVAILTLNASALPAQTMQPSQPSRRLNVGK